MVHRGPDDQGIVCGTCCIALGMRRLSVIDLSTGHQPISNETKRIWVVLNGEIYNYHELAAWLISRGHRLATSSDTEVIVHLYEELAMSVFISFGGCLPLLYGTKSEIVYLLLGIAWV